MASRTSNYWMDFFLNAHLPQNVATKYAVIFTDHRIQEDMLGDLTKDMLYDMGIKTMGDVIAILKHAKEVNDEKIEFQLLGKPSSASNRAKAQVSSANQSKSGANESISGPRVSSSTSSTIRPTKRPATDDFEVESHTNIKRRVVTPVKTETPTNIIKTRAAPIQTKVTFNSTARATSSSSAGKPSGKLSKTHQDALKVSVFSRLGNNDEPTKTIRLTQSSEPTITRTLTGFKGTVSNNKKPSGIKDRLGITTSSTNKPIRGNSSVRTVISSTIKPNQPRNTVSLKKTIFDRLGRVTF